MISCTFFMKDENIALCTQPCENKTMKDKRQQSRAEVAEQKFEIHNKFWSFLPLVVKWTWKLEFQAQQSDT